MTICSKLDSTQYIYINSIHQQFANSIFGYFAECRPQENAQYYSVQL